MMITELLSHQFEIWSKLSYNECSTCKMFFPDVWTVVLSANMSQATEILLMCNGRALIKILKTMGPKTDP